MTPTKPASSIAFTISDCELLERFSSSRVVFNKDLPEREQFVSIKRRLAGLFEPLASAQIGAPVLKHYASRVNPNGLAPHDLWACVYPEVAGHYSFALQVGLIIRPDGAELCFCLGKGSRQAGKAANLTDLELNLSKAKARLIDLPEDVVDAAAASLPPAFHFRKQWRSEPADSEFVDFRAWLHYAASEESSGASVSRYFTRDELESLGAGIASECESLLATFTPILEFVYADSPLKAAIKDDCTSAELLHNLVKDVDLSSTSLNKWDGLRRQLATWLQLDEDDIYIISAQTRASNIPIRLVQGRARDTHYRLGVAVIGTPELPLALRHATRQATEGRYDAVAVISKNSGTFEMGGYSVRAGDQLEHSLTHLFPNAKKVVVRSTDKRITRPMLRVAQFNASGDFSANSIDDLTVESVRTECIDRGLEFPDELLISCITALRADKHLLLTGAPGTGKTSLAEALASAATKAGICSGYTMTTATSDWTSVDTVGAYRPTRLGDLRFHPGLIVESIVRSEWAIIDEFNRADIDKAIGQLFTLLSGKMVVLPHEVETSSGFQRIALIPKGEPADTKFLEVELSATWRLIATMNDTDLDLLYDVSQALKRRFALVEVNPVVGNPLRKLLGQFETGNYAVDSLIATLSIDRRFNLGIAIWIDLVKYLRERVTIHAEVEADFDPIEQVIGAARLFFFPQGIATEAITQAVTDAGRVLNRNDAPPDSQIS